MITPTSLGAQLDGLGQHELRVLVAGGGVAGLSLAQLLRGRGLRPVLVERARSDHDEGGYMLGLMPFVDPVITALGVEAEYLNRSVGMHRYRLRGASGRALRDYSLDAALSRFGRFRGIERSPLLGVAATADAPVAFGTTVTALDQTTSRVAVRLREDGADVDAEFDAVVVAEGMASSTSDLVVDADRVGGHDTGWGGWLAWIVADEETDLYEETWGAGFFLGLYPVPGRVGLFIGGPRTTTAGGLPRFAEQVCDRLATIDGRGARGLAAAATTDTPYYWTLTDVRSPTWTSGRVVLLGDAATGFLPTAGVGAAMAMESAGVLAEHLAATSPQSIPDALRAFERVQPARRDRPGQLASARSTDVPARQGPGPRARQRRSLRRSEVGPGPDHQAARGPHSVNMAERRRCQRPTNASTEGCAHRSAAPACSSSFRRRTIVVSVSAGSGVGSP